MNDIQINDHIALNGTELNATLLPTGSPGAGTRTLKIEGTNACRTADPTTPLCSLDAGGASRILHVQAGLELRIGYLLLTSGLATASAPGGASGGCILADCAGCSLFLDNSVLRNCTAAARGGGAAVQGGGALTAVATQFIANTAAQGAGLMLMDGAVALRESTFRDNTAIGDTDDTTVELGELRGPAGGGAALDNVTGTLEGCTFMHDAASTEDVILLSNPDFPQARGGGLFLAHSTVNMSGSTFTSCTAAWGGGVYVHASTFEMSTNAFVGNLATTGDGGGLFAGDCPRVFANATLITGNAAGGHMGGGFGAINTDFDLDNAAFSNNEAHNGCGGGMGLDAGSTLSIHFGSVLFNNSARSGGASACRARCACRNARALTRGYRARAQSAATRASACGRRRASCTTTQQRTTPAARSSSPARPRASAMSPWLATTRRRVALFRLSARNSTSRTASSATTWRCTRTAAL